MPALSVRHQINRHILSLALVVFTYMWAGPFLWMWFMSLRTSQEIYASPYGFPIPAHFDKFLSAFRDFGYANYFRNSVIVTVFAVVLSITAASMAAYGFARARYRFVLREPIFLLIFISIMFPPQIILLALFQVLVRYGLYNTLPGLILVYAATSLPFSIYILRSFFIQIPQEIEDAARIDGCNDWQAFWRVMLPMARPALATVIILNTIHFWNEFLYAVVFITKQENRTLPLAVMFFLGEAYQDVGMLATGIVIASLPIVILYLFFSEQFIKGMTAGALKG
jgi:multiple sugar transport system permease protein/raffinose/stachyose/melibiose transport system permease protein